MKHLTLLIAVFSFSTFSVDMPDMEIDLDQEVVVEKIDKNEDSDLDVLLSEVKKDKEILLREIAQKEDDEEEVATKDNEPSENDFKKRLDLGDVELRVSHRKKEAYIEPIIKNRDEEENSMEIKKRGLASKKKK